MGEIPEDAYRAFTTTVGLITTHDDRGPNVIAAEWTYNVSFDPMLIMVVLGRSKATYQAIRTTKEFGVNLCAEDQTVQSTLAGHFTKKDTDKLSSELFETYPATQIKAPLIRGCLLNAECRLVDEFPVGDHVALVGEVVAATWDSSKKPLVLSRGYRRVSERIPTTETLSATVTPMGSSPGTQVSVAGEYRSKEDRGSRAVEVQILGPSGKAFGKAAGKTDRDGYYDIAWSVPKDAGPGTYAVIASVGSVEGRARLTVLGPKA